ncbi:hypothetical protein FOL47_006084 [Perkinsus chesapeaki]|uniref:Uncharacterized protein n=1 Tax=Perkinsus chesapeaki TaxID=330153 RepID=A0A7J6LTT1_PERCH|nr:hypothetical protein FOL47_006084 [Perkinsus chesapeaki]
MYSAGTQLFVTSMLVILLIALINGWCMGAGPDGVYYLNFAGPPVQCIVVAVWEPTEPPFIGYSVSCSSLAAVSSSMLKIHPLDYPYFIDPSSHGDYRHFIQMINNHFGIHAEGSLHEFTFDESANTLSSSFLNQTVVMRHLK